MKYNVMCSGSGFGVWDENGRKIQGFGSGSIGRFQALRFLYELNGWNWLKSKYVKAEPWLADI